MKNGRVLKLDTLPVAPRVTCETVMPDACTLKA